MRLSPSLSQELSRSRNFMRRARARAANAGARAGATISHDRRLFGCERRCGGRTTCYATALGAVGPVCRASARTAQRWRARAAPVERDRCRGQLRVQRAGAHRPGAERSHARGPGARDVAAHAEDWLDDNLPGLVERLVRAGSSASPAGAEPPERRSADEPHAPLSAAASLSAWSDSTAGSSLWLAGGRNGTPFLRGMTWICR